MAIGLILLSLAALCLGIFGWLWLCAGFRRGGVRGALGLAAVQVSGLCLAYGVLRGQPMIGLFTALFPPLIGPEVARLAAFQTVLGEVAIRAAPYAAAVGLVCLIVRPLRVWSAGLALFAALLAGVVLGEEVSKQAMCKAGARHGFTTFQRQGFGWSLANAPSEFQVDVHGLAEVEGQRLGWSYRAMDWYSIPANVTRADGGAVFDCATGGG